MTTEEFYGWLGFMSYEAEQEDRALKAAKAKGKSRGR